MKISTFILFLFVSVVGYAQVDLPVTFEDTMLDYDLTDFGGNNSAVEVDPTDPNNMVGRVTKTDVAELWAGTTMGEFGFVNAIPFAMNQTKMTVRVWSPDAGIPIRLKVEDANDPTISVETEANTTMAGLWEILEFDFSNEAPGTAAINIANTYKKASIFFNFGTTGADAGEKTYYWDDVEFGGGGVGSQVDLPVTFEDATIDYGLTDFGGNASAVEVDPTDPNNTVARSTKTDVAELWAGTTMGLNGFASVIPFTMDDTKMTVRVWSPDAGIPIRLKVEDAGDPTISVETETTTTVASAWEMLEFDFSNEVSGTAALNLGNTYSKASIFFNFGTTGADAGEKTYYWDDVEFVGGGGGPSQVDLPITFEDSNVDYALADFGGNSSAVEVDPTDPNNMVGRATKSDMAELWAGTTNGENGLANAIPFTMDDTKMKVRVWSPDADIPVRLKVENAGDPTISVETEANTTVAGAWETLEFDFSNEAAGTAALNVANTYDKVSIFFNFGTTGPDAGEKTYYWDDVEFGGGSSLDQVDLPITFEDSNVNYALADFGGNGSAIEVDPTDPNNMVGRATKSDMAELWAGTTNGENGLANAIPFTMDDTKMKVRVWSPDADIPVRLKVENAGDPTISVETEANTTVAGAWETLEFDFSNEAAGTAALNVANTYDKVSIFFNFGTTGADAGEKTYYWDDVDFGGRFTVVDVIVNSPDHTVLETAVIAAELDDDLSGAGPFTVFAPTDAALNALPIDLLTALLADPTGDLAEVLLYHVLGAEVYSTDLSDGQMATTLQGEDVTVTIDGADVFINQAKVTVVDIQTDNGVVHVIDAVMLPPSFVGLEILDAAKSNIKISPNPANSFFNVEFPESLTEAAQITLLDVSGKILIQEKAYNKNTQINTSELNAGTYFLRIDTNVASYYQKVMIAK
ncbi:MAG: fasciclin domain-containing protein [Bacteroidetes bacterium]|nr:fasciclin domain-containing protein [Bacteroidota bacterium]